MALNPSASPAEICKIVLDKYGVKINSGTASSVRSEYPGKKPIPPKPAIAAAAEKRTEKPKKEIDAFIEGLKHVKEAVKLLGDKDSVIDLIELL